MDYLIEEICKKINNPYHQRIQRVLSYIEPHDKVIFEDFLKKINERL